MVKSVSMSLLNLKGVGDWWAYGEGGGRTEGESVGSEARGKCEDGEIRADGGCDGELGLIRIHMIV